MPCKYDICSYIHEISKCKRTNCNLSHAAISNYYEIKTKALSEMLSRINVTFNNDTDVLNCISNGTHIMNYKMIIKHN